jgi:hypothetical protein
MFERSLISTRACERKEERRDKKEARARFFPRLLGEDTLGAQVNNKEEGEKRRKEENKKQIQEEKEHTHERRRTNEKFVTAWC